MAKFLEYKDSLTTANEQPQPESQVVDAEPELHPFLRSNLAWDASKLGPFCSLAEGGTTLINNGRASQSHWRFLGGSSTLTLTEKDQVYWEVEIYECYLGRQAYFQSWECELGLAVEADLKRADVQTPVGEVNKCSPTLQIPFELWQTTGEDSQGEDKPSRSSSEEPVFESSIIVRMFFDGPGAQLYFFTKPMKRYKVDLSRGPVVFFVRIADREKCGKEIRVQLKSGKDVTATAETLKMLENLSLAHRSSPGVSSVTPFFMTYDF